MIRTEEFKVGIFETNPGYGGGNSYQMQIREALSGACGVKVVPAYPRFLRRFCRPQTVLKIAYLSMVKSRINLWIRNFLGVVGMPPVSIGAINLALFFHLDYAAIPRFRISQWLDRLYWRNAERCEEVVVISEFWREFFFSKGFRKMHLIPCGFDLAQFVFEPSEIEDFKKRYSLSGRPIIYLGNCAAPKGVIDAYAALQHLPFHLVTSGTREIRIPALHLTLSFRDYLLLLKSAAVVITMSKFLEGWNITAHEAMLCRTPVIGSGKGGMRELLEGGRQLICEDFSRLPEMVEIAIRKSERLGNDGFEYAKNFTREKFKKSWQTLVGDLAAGQAIKREMRGKTEIRSQHDHS